MAASEIADKLPIPPPGHATFRITTQRKSTCSPEARGPRVGGHRATVAAAAILADRRCCRLLFLHGRIKLTLRKALNHSPRGLSIEQIILNPIGIGMPRVILLPRKGLDISRLPHDFRRMLQYRRNALDDSFRSYSQAHCASIGEPVQMYPMSDHQQAAAPQTHWHQSKFRF